MTVICEPQCYGFEHAEVNASLIAVFCRAFPKEEFIFLAERAHLEHVKECLLAHPGPEIQFREISIAPRRCSHPRRLIREISVYREIFKFTLERDADRIVFCAITAQGLMVSKILLHQFTSVRCVAVLHGVIETVVEWKQFWKQQFVFWFRFPFLWGNSERMSFLVFGSFIRTSLSERFPKMRKFIRAIDLPYVFQPPPAYVSRVHTIRFGALGVASRSKGTDLFFKMASEIRSSSRQAEFILIGPMIDPALKKPVHDCVTIPSSGPLSREEYTRWARGIDYAVFFHKQESYRFSTSAAFFDALSYLKPVIALRNPLFDYYFRTMGDIGYLCDRYDEMAEVIKMITDNFPNDRYRQQCENILLGRERLSVPELAKQIQTVWN